MSESATSTWDESNFKGNRKFLKKCAGFRSNIELYLKGLRNAFMQTFVKHKDLQKCHFWISRMENHVYFQRSTGNKEFGLKDFEGNKIHFIDKPSPAHIIELLQEEEENHIYLKFTNIRKIFLFKIDGSSLKQVAEYEYKKGPEVSVLGTAIGKRTVYLGAGKFLNEIKFPSPKDTFSTTGQHTYVWEGASTTEYMRINIIRVSKNGQRIAVADTERTVKIIDYKSRDELKIFEVLHQSTPVLQSATLCLG